MCKVARDIRPFKSVEDPGFRNLANCLVKLGAQYGCFEVDKALPSRHTIKRHAIHKADKKQKEVIKLLQNAIKANGFIGITTDMWTDDNNRSYLSLTFHFVEDGFLYHCVLAVD